MRDQPLAVPSPPLSLSLSLSLFLFLSIFIKDARAFAWSVFELSRIGFSSVALPARRRITALFV